MYYTFIFFTLQSNILLYVNQQSFIKIENKYTIKLTAPPGSNAYKNTVNNHGKVNIYLL